VVNQLQSLGKAPAKRRHSESESENITELPDAISLFTSCQFLFLIFLMYLLTPTAMQVVVNCGSHT